MRLMKLKFETYKQLNDDYTSLLKEVKDIENNGSIQQTPEWKHGYMMALGRVLKLIESEDH